MAARKSPHSRCPHCKNKKKGFRITFTIHGSAYEDRDFKGNVIGGEKNEVHDADRYVECLNCGMGIPAEDVRSDQS